MLSPQKSEFQGKTKVRCLGTKGMALEAGRRQNLGNRKSRRNRHFLKCYGFLLLF